MNVTGAPSRVVQQWLCIDRNGRLYFVQQKVTATEVRREGYEVVGVLLCEKELFWQPRMDLDE